MSLSSCPVGETNLDPVEMKKTMDRLMMNSSNVKNMIQSVLQDQESDIEMMGGDNSLAMSIVNKILLIILVYISHKFLFSSSDKTKTMETVLTMDDSCVEEMRQELIELNRRGDFGETSGEVSAALEDEDEFDNVFNQLKDEFRIITETFEMGGGRKRTHKKRTHKRRHRRGGTKSNLRDLILARRQYIEPNSRSTSSKSRSKSRSIKKLDSHHPAISKLNDMLIRKNVKIEELEDSHSRSKSRSNPVVMGIMTAKMNSRSRSNKSKKTKKRNIKIRTEKFQL